MAKIRVAENAAQALIDGTEGRDGRPVQVGDRIAYAVKWGSSAVLQIAEVIGFRDGHDSYAGTVLKIEIKAEDNDKPSLILARRGQFVRIP